MANRNDQCELFPPCDDDVPESHHRWNAPAHRSITPGDWLSIEHEGRAVIGMIYRCQDEKYTFVYWDNLILRFGTTTRGRIGPWDDELTDLFRGQIAVVPNYLEKCIAAWVLCRCDCGVQKEVPHYNLTKGYSTKCQQCCHTRHGISSTRLYRAWDSLRRGGKLAKEWRDVDAFRKAVGDPPDEKACLTRYDGTKPHSSKNTFWMYPLLKNDPAFKNRLKQIRKKAREERVAHDKMLMRIRNAKSREERNRCMIAARKAGYSCGLIGMAAKVTTQRAHFIVETRNR